jgi:hypothetical protein
LKALHELRMGLDQRIGGKNWETLKGEEIEMIKELRRIVSDKIDLGVQELGAQGVLKDAGKWKQLNKVYGALKQIEKPLEKSIQQRNAWVNVAGLRWRDLMLSGVGSPVGAAVGGLVADEEGAAVGGILGGGLGVANKLFQTERGLLWRAHLGERLGSLVTANKAIASVGQRIAAATSAFVGGTAPKAIRAAAAPGGERLVAAFDDSREHQRELAAAKTKHDQFRVHYNKLSALVGDPERTASQIARGLRGAENLSSGLRDKLIMKQLQVYSFLHSKAPKDPLSAFAVNPAVTKYEPSVGEIDRWNRYVRAAQAPMSILDDLRAGDVTPEAAETVKTLYPSLFAEIQVELMGKVGQMQKELPYQDRFSIGIMFDVPTDPSLAPEFMNALQGRFEQAEGGGAPASSGSISNTGRASGANQLSSEGLLTRSESLAQ